MLVTYKSDVNLKSTMKQILEQLISENMLFLLGELGIL